MMIYSEDSYTQMSPKCSRIDNDEDYINTYLTIFLW